MVLASDCAYLPTTVALRTQDPLGIRGSFQWRNTCGWWTGASVMRIGISIALVGGKLEDAMEVLAMVGAVGLGFCTAVLLARLGMTALIAMMPTKRT
jgi:hypothetical protein